MATKDAGKILFRNPIDTIRSHVYATEHECDLKEPREQLVHVDGRKNVIKIYVFGIPVGVSPYANETLITGNEPRRLYIFSDRPLSKHLREFVGAHHQHIFGGGNNESRVLDLVVPFAAKVTQPWCNFYVSGDANGNDYTSFVEYRYFRQRFTHATAFFNPNSGYVFRFVLPEECRAPIALIMPENYSPISPRRGYIAFGHGLIVHIFTTKHFMVSAEKPHSGNGGNVVKPSTFVVTDTQIMQTENMLDFVKNKFSKMGFLNMYAAGPRQLVAYDDLVTAVLGDYSNLNI